MVGASRYRSRGPAAPQYRLVPNFDLLHRDGRLRPGLRVHADRLVQGSRCRKRCWRYFVSCVSAAFCVAADETGNVVTEYDGTWSAPENIDPQSNSNFYGFTSISCATVAFCVAVDYDGNASVGVG